ncbi:glucose/arabinose dehydrogenase [Litorivivens lipolytica]|uniref:Glucose/arabinose dehydrogenase n=1 Tax=Litorivivens lipolytica TaxID=1524264 RepID=A0A7W4Z4N8_9GAMM|nr:PQQ-dependent sugar dehydrogenase [Litorivivens lipolytica]MBB3046684.1 glucose/arabinose dehydrogenase [Litorivivens lipolytica]
MTVKPQHGGSTARFLLAVVLLLVVGGGVLFKLYVAPQVGDFRVILNAIVGSGIDTPEESRLKQTLNIDERFTLRIFAANLPNARWLLPTSRDDLLVSRPRKGDIVLLHADSDGDGRSDGRETLLTELNMPHGMTLIGDWLYIAEQDAIGRVKFNAQARAVEGPFQRLLSGLPGGGNHWAKSLELGPDGWLYFNVGSSCNVCTEEDTRRGSLMRMRPDGSGAEIYAAGLRNAMGFAWAPWDQALYAADISRDLLGDDYPPDELNLVVEGGFYGWPFANGFGDADPDLGSLKPDTLDTIDPVLAIPAHTTPLGLHFPRHESLAEAFPRSAFMALHGSWNRSVPDGYRLELLQWQSDGQISVQTLVDGFWTGDDLVGRPVDVEEDSAGNLYLSDDYGSAVYRLSLSSDLP